MAQKKVSGLSRFFLEKRGILKKRDLKAAENKGWRIREL